MQMLMLISLSHYLHPKCYLHSQSVFTNIKEHKHAYVVLKWLLHTQLMKACPRKKVPLEQNIFYQSLKVFCIQAMILLPLIFVMI